MPNALVQKRACGEQTYGNPLPSLPVTYDISYSSATTAGNMLMCVALGFAETANDSGSVVITTPVTTDGSIWVPVLQAAPAPPFAYPPGVPNGTPWVALGLSVFCIFNASVKAASPYVDSFTVTDSALGGGVNDTLVVEGFVYEFSGSTLGSVIASASATGNGNTVATANLITTSTALIYVAAVLTAGNDPLSHGTGYTAGVMPSSEQYGSDQYILNESAGSIVTAFRALSGNTFDWLCIALAFGLGSSPIITPSGVAQPMVWINS